MSGVTYCSHKNVNEVEKERGIIVHDKEYRIHNGVPCIKDRAERCRFYLASVLTEQAESYNLEYVLKHRIEISKSQ